MILRPAPLACLLVCALLSGTAYADLREDITRCRQIADDSGRLACFDAIAAADPAVSPSQLSTAERREMLAALDREFRFSPQLRTGKLSFRLAANGELKTSRDTAVVREVERLVRRLVKALSGSEGWGLRIVVHGGSVLVSRGTPYTGEELAVQSHAGMARTGLSQDRYAVEIGEPAQPKLWDDGRIRNANEHVDIAVTGLD